MSSYNLDENVSESFDFTLSGFKYKMAYPSSKDIMELSEVANSGVEIESKINELKQDLLTSDNKDVIQKQIDELTQKAQTAQQTFLDWCMEYITPELDSAPKIKDALLSKNIKYLQAFMHMVQTELQS